MMTSKDAKRLAGYGAYVKELERCRGAVQGVLQGTVQQGLTTEMVAARGTASTRIDLTIFPARASRVESPSAIVHS